MFKLIEVRSFGDHEEQDSAKKVKKVITFKEISIGEEFEVVKSSSCPKGQQSPKYKKIPGVVDPLYPDDNVTHNCEIISGVKKGEKTFFYNPLPVVVFR